MASKLTRPTNFHPALLPHQHKYFRPEAIDALASREDLDQEREIANFFGMIDELRRLAAVGGPGSSAAPDLGGRWKAQTDAVTDGNRDSAGRLRAMTRDGLADPVTAPQMPFSAKELAFLEQIIEKLKEIDA